MMSKKNFLLLFINILILNLLSFWQAFSFDFWRDDWYVVWGVLHNPVYLYQWGVVKLHPISALALFLASEVYKWNSFLWEMQGFVLRTIDAVIVYYFSRALTKSKKVGIYSSLVFASFSLGIESFDWGSAIATALLLPLFCITFYFWIEQKKNTSYKKIVISLIVLTILCDPIRGIFLPIILYLYNFLLNLKVKKKISLKITNKNILILFICTCAIILYFTINRSLLYSQFLNHKLIFFLPFITFFKKILNIIVIPFNALGNILIGWILPIPDYADVGKRNIVSIIVGAGSIIYFSIITYSYLKRKEKKYSIIIFLLIWIMLLYIPNWFADITFIPAVTNRYYTMSAVGLACLVGYTIDKLKKLQIPVLIFLLAVNLYRSNYILSLEYSYRSVKSVEKLWEQIYNEVPKNAVNSLFIFQGNSLVSRYALLTAYSIPFGLRRGYTNPDDFPVSTNYIPTIKQFLCEDNFIRPSMSSRTTLQKQRISLAQVYSWYYDDNKQRLINTTIKTRNNLLYIVACRPKMN